MNFNSLKINSIGGSCEDSVNIINSSGTISELVVIDSFQDSIDLDFSNLQINSVRTNNSGNDCLDVSGGIYKIINGNFNKCSDKSISIGEKSYFLLTKLLLITQRLELLLRIFPSFSLK